MNKTVRVELPPAVSKKQAEQEANRDQLTYGLESLLVDLATDQWLAGIKPGDLKPDVCTTLAGMLIAYATRARNLHKQMEELAASLRK